MRLLEKISTLVIVLAIFISLVLGVVVYNLTKSEMEQSVGQNQLQLTRATMQGIDRVLYERCQDIREVAGSVVFKKYLDNRSNEADVEERLGIYLATSGPWDALEIWDKEGNLAFSSEGQQEGKIRTKDGQEQNFLRAALGGEDYVSDLVISGYSGKPTVYFVFPMRDETLPDRPVVGAAMGQFSWSVIEQIVADAENGTSHAYLLNSRKEIIAEGGERNKLFRTNAGSDREGQAEKAVGIWKGTGISPLLWSRAAQTGYLNYRGNGWELTIDTPASAAFSSADESSWKTVEALLAIMLLKVIVLLIFLNSLVIRPLRKLETTAREISAGELEKRAAVTTKDEIGLLAQSLNQMTDKLLETAKFPESIIASMADALIVLRADKRIKMVNKSVQVLLGYGEKELIGRPVDDIMACETDENGNTTSCVGINQLVRRGHMKDTKEKVNF
jgi:HAMP domain-containing protein